MPPNNMLERVTEIFRTRLGGATVLEVAQFRLILAQLGMDVSEEQLLTVTGDRNAPTANGVVAWEDFLKWAFSSGPAGGFQPAKEKAPATPAAEAGHREDVAQAVAPTEAEPVLAAEASPPEEAAQAPAAAVAEATPQEEASKEAAAKPDEASPEREVEEAVIATVAEDSVQAAAAEAGEAAPAAAEAATEEAGDAAAPADAATIAAPAEGPVKSKRPDGQPPRLKINIMELLRAGSATPSDLFAQAAFATLLEELLEEHPYLKPEGSLFPHPLQYWVQHCVDCFRAKKFEQAQEHYLRVRAGLEVDQRQIREAFRRFDVDGSGHLDASECKHMCAYLGWGHEEAALFDLDRDGRVTLPDFQNFVGRLGGVQQLFEQRRLRISASRRDVCDYAGIAVGARVRAHYYVQGSKSNSWKEAQVLAVGVERRYGQTAGAGPSTLGVLLEFGFGAGWRARQVVPPAWILSGVEDARVAAALRESGILDEQQAFWALLLPDTEMQAIERLEGCQRRALAVVRAQAAANHEKALPGLRERFAKLKFGERSLQTVLSWVQDLAPVVIHVHLDRIGAFLEVDEFYRNQFETKTSCGWYDPENSTRKSWENELFGSAYDGSKPFERPKYGALNVMNDYRGVVSARQYGDSYLVLKDVRLRCTFASTDSGGIAGSRLAVLDKYAHVLAEYNDEELKGLVAMAEAAAEAPALGGAADERSAARLLRGGTQDPTMDWVTFGFPELGQDRGCHYFEVDLHEGCSAPQVGLLSTAFQQAPGASSTQGVGDDEHGWAVDGQNAAKWHGGPRPWGQVWKSEVKGSGVHALSAAVTVGVAVDLDTRQLWFASEGVWDEHPTFTAKELAEGVSVFPAASLRGRAAFNFGPNFKHKPPASIGGPFGRWPSAATGAVRLDVPQLGNEETLSMYKEAQIHGEVSLKRNVQRLVACRKYLDMPKTQRSWTLRVNGAGTCSGTFNRAGAHADMPLYRSSSGATIFFHPASSRWRMSTTSNLDNWFCSAPGSKDACEPPRRGWELPEEQSGSLPPESLVAGLTDLGIEDLQAKLTPLLYEVPDGTKQVLWSRWQALWPSLGAASSSTTAEEAWERGIQAMQRQLIEDAGLPKAAVVIETRHPYEAKRDTWRREVRVPGAAQLAVHFHRESCTFDRRSQFRVLSGGLQRNYAGIGARVEVTATAAGDKLWGTVVERSTPGSSGSGWWKVRLDRRAPPEQGTTAETLPAVNWPEVGDKMQALYKNGRWYPAKIAEKRPDGTFLIDWDDGDPLDREKPRDKIKPRDGDEPVAHRRELDDLPRYAPVAVSGQHCFAMCRDSPQSISVRYERSSGLRGDEQGYSLLTVGDEIGVFAVDRSSPLSPFSIKSFAGLGPAQQKGVSEGFFLDLVATACGPSRDTVREVLQSVNCAEGEDGSGPADAASRDLEALINAAFRHPEETVRQLNDKLRKLSEVTLIFTNSASPKEVQLLPEAHVRYPAESTVGKEILSLLSAGGKLMVCALGAEGPARAAGVRVGWLLDLQGSAALNPGGTFPTEEAAIADPSKILSLAGTTLAFNQPCPQPAQRFVGSGAAGVSRWGGFAVEGEAADFEFSTDGDGSDAPEKRWGVWALVVPVTEAMNPILADFEVNIEKSEGVLLGLDIDTTGGSFIFITGVDNDGLVHRWNEDHPDKIIRAGDFIVEVCGIRDDPEAMVERVRGTGELTLTMRRSPLPCCSKGHPLQPSSLGFTSCSMCGAYVTDGFKCQAQECSYGICTFCHGQSRDNLPPPIADFDAFAKRYLEASRRAEGCRNGAPEVERETWDEQRLRALCARHGWEFEWMTEDGERKRRARERQSVWRLEERHLQQMLGDSALPDGQVPNVAP